MILTRKRRLGSRVLRLGYHGSDVHELQDRLTKLGYECGEINGKYGYLTQEAVEFFQKDYGLRIDGIAGREVFSLLTHEDLPVHRRVHLVKEGETLERIAAQYNVGKEAFQRHSKRELYVNQRLCFFDRQVWGIVRPTSLAKESFYQNSLRLTGAFFPVELGKEPILPLERGYPQIAMVNIPYEDQKLGLHKLLKNRKEKKAALAFLKQIQRNTQGIYLPWRSLSRVDGLRYLGFIRALTKRKPAKKRLIVMLHPSMPRWNFTGGIPFAQLAENVDQVVLPITSAGNSSALISKEAVEREIISIIRYVPSWKILLEVPLFSMLLSTSQETQRELLSYDAAMSMVFQQGGRQRRDEQGRSYYSIFKKGEEHHLWVAHREQIQMLIACVNRWNLAGIVLAELGMEDKRMWKVVANHFTTAKFP